MGTGSYTTCRLENRSLAKNRLKQLLASNLPSLVHLNLSRNSLMVVSLGRLDPLAHLLLADNNFQRTQDLDLPP